MKKTETKIIANKVNHINYFLNNLKLFKSFPA
jgi:hypothetical protein